MRYRRGKGNDPHFLARQLLLASLDPNGDLFSSLSRIDWSDIPWNWLLERARAHRVLALFSGRLDQYGYTDTLPQNLQERLGTIRCEVRRKAAAAILTLREVAEICDRRSIPFVVLKGSYLAEKVYGDPELRVFNDVDVMVPHERVDDLGQELLEREYFFYVPPYIQRHARKSLRARSGPGRVPISTEEARRLLRIHHYHFTFGPRETDPRIPVEVHWHIASPRLLTVPVEKLWAQTTNTVLGGVAVKTLDPEATLLHAAVHATKSPLPRFRLLPLCDFVWIAERLGGQVRPPALRSMARSWGVERHLVCASQIAHDVFPFELSGAWRQYSRCSRWSRACLRLAKMDASLVDRAVSSTKQVDRAVPSTRLGRFAKRLFRETFWDLAFFRAPRAALYILWTRLLRLTALISAPRHSNKAGAVRK